MNVAPRYLGRGSWLSRRDPRLLILVLICYVFAAVQVWDLRILASMATLAFAYYRSASIPWRAVRANWAYVAFFISFIVVVNTLITGGELRGFVEEDLHIYFRLPLINTPVSAEMLSYAGAQLLRFGSMAAMGFPIAFAIAPGDIGPTFARLRVPYKFAYALDLTFRFIPSMAADMQTTMDAQRIRDMSGTGCRAGRLAGCAGWDHSSCRSRSTRSSARRTRSTRWTCARSAPASAPGCASWRMDRPTGSSWRLGWPCWRP